MAATNVEAHRAGHEAFNRRDFEATIRRYADRISWTDQARGLTFTTPREFREDFLAGWVEAASDIRIAGPRYLDAGQTVVCVFIVDTFYRSPAEAIAAPPERLAYVVAHDPAGRAKDAVAVLDADPASADYGTVVGWSELPTAGNELHHFGWNACSSPCAMPVTATTGSRWSAAT